MAHNMGKVKAAAENNLDDHGLASDNDALRKGNKCTPAFRARVRKAFGSKCAYCGLGDDGSSGYGFGVDRLIPKSLGGRYMPDNVTYSCISCNSSKGVQQPLPGRVKSLADVEAGRAVILRDWLVVRPSKRRHAP